MEKCTMTKIKNDLLRAGMVLDKGITDKTLREVIKKEAKLQFENTLSLLKMYREIKYHINPTRRLHIVRKMGLSMDDITEEYQNHMVRFVDDFFVGNVDDYLYAQLRHEAKTIDHSERKLGKLEDAVDIIRNELYRQDRELLYLIIYNEYMSESVMKICEVMDLVGVKRKAYCRLRDTAIELVDKILWPRTGESVANDMLRRVVELDIITNNDINL